MIGLRQELQEGPTNVWPKPKTIMKWIPLTMKSRLKPRE